MSRVFDARDIDATIFRFLPPFIFSSMPPFSLPGFHIDISMPLTRLLPSARCRAYPSSRDLSAAFSILFPIFSYLFAAAIALPAEPPLLIACPPRATVRCHYFH